jgi:hypothetical protein
METILPAILPRSALIRDTGGYLLATPFVHSSSHSPAAQPINNALEKAMQAMSVCALGM